MATMSYPLWVRKGFIGVKDLAAKIQKSRGRLGHRGTRLHIEKTSARVQCAGVAATSYERPAWAGYGDCNYKEQSLDLD